MNKKLQISILNLRYFHVTFLLPPAMTICSSSPIPFGWVFKCGKSTPLYHCKIPFLCSLMCSSEPFNVDFSCFLFTDAVNFRYFTLLHPKSPVDQKDSLIFSDAVTSREWIYPFGDGISSCGGWGNVRLKIYCTQQRE